MNQISQTMLHDEGIMEYDHSKQNNFESGICSGQTEYSSRSLIQSQNTPIRVVIVQSYSPNNVSSLGKSSDRPVCFDRQSQYSNVFVRHNNIALATDALLISLDRMIAYAYPPTCLILQHMP